MRLRSVGAALLGLSLLAGGLAADEARVLTLKAYLAQVRQQGPDYLRAISNRKVADLNRYLMDKHWTASVSPGIQQNGGQSVYYPPQGMEPYWSRTNSFYGSAQVSDQTSFGLNPSLNYYWHRNTQLTDANDPNEYPSWGDQYSLGLGVPLWQNFLGQQTRLGDAHDLKSSDAGQASYDYSVAAAVEAAELAYETLAYDRAQVARDQDLLDRYGRLAQWAQAHGGDLDRLQAQTAGDGLEQTLERLDDQVRADGMAVNRASGSPGVTVPPIEDLDALAAEDGTVWPEQAPARLDLQYAQLSLQAEDLSVRLSQEGVKLPVNLNLSMSGNLSGGMPGVPNGYYYYNPALTEPNLENYAVSLGVTVPFDYFLPRWTMPLKIVEIQDQQQALDLAQTTNYDDAQWADMTTRYKKNHQRVEDAAKLEAQQQRKAELGEQALAHGKLGMYEALAFESAWTNATLSRLQWVQQRLTLLAQIRLYQAQLNAWMDPGQPPLPLP